MSLNWSPQGVKLIFHPKWWSSWRFGSWKYLRHTYASIQIDLNAIPKYIQNQMGRALIKLTLNTYCHLTKDINREAATRFGEAIFEENGIRKGQRITGCPVTRWNNWRRQPESNWWMAVLQTAALPLGYAANSIPYLLNVGAGNGIWTRDIDLGKVALYHWAIPAQISRPLKNAQFRFSSRKAIILITGIH